MKHTLMFLMIGFAFIFSGMAFGQSPDQDMVYSQADVTEGLLAYDEGNWQEARERFESLLKDGLSSAALYYDLGNCYYKLGEKGKAVWAYESARRLDPRDPDIEWNLNLLNKQLEDKPEETHVLNRLILPLRSDELAVILSVILGIFSCNLFCLTFIKSARGFFFKLGVILAIPLLASSLLIGVRWFEIKDRLAVVQDREIFVRYGPNQDSTRAFLLHEGTKVKIKKVKGDWYSIQFGARQRGWLPKSSVIRI
jgi:tetratricopeptide (TPR) repeat protein